MQPTAQAVGKSGKPISPNGAKEEFSRTVPRKDGADPRYHPSQGYLGNFTDWRAFLLGGFHQVGEGEGPFLRARLGCGDLQHLSFNLELILWQSVTADVENHHWEINKVRLVHMHRWIWLFSPKPDPPRVPRRSPAAHEIWLLSGSRLHYLEVAENRHT